MIIYAHTGSLVEVTHLEQTGATGTTVNLTWSVSVLEYTIHGQIMSRVIFTRGT